jgi:hypothetical protein
MAAHAADTHASAELEMLPIDRVDRRQLRDLLGPRENRAAARLLSGPAVDGACVEVDDQSVLSTTTGHV